jgi:hypothetical protein
VSLAEPAALPLLGKQSKRYFCHTHSSLFFHCSIPALSELTN